MRPRGSSPGAELPDWWTRPHTGDHLESRMRSADEEDGDDLANPDDEEDHREVTHPDDFPDVDDPEAAGSAPSDADDADDADNDNDDAGADDNDADNGDANDGADGDARLPRPPSASGPSVGTTTEDDAADEVALKGRLALVLDLAHDGFDDDSSDDDGGNDDGGDDDGGDDNAGQFYIITFCGSRRGGPGVVCHP